MTRRTERIGEQLKGELARLLREEVTDPRIGLVTLTRVDVAPDLHNAKVFWSALHADDGRDPREDAVGETAEGLASAAGFLRRRLAKVLHLKRVPELRFVHDPSLALGSETLNLIRELGDGASE